LLGEIMPYIIMHIIMHIIMPCIVVPCIILPCIIVVSDSRDTRVHELAVITPREAQARYWYTQRRHRS
jgi:hypothetical protein